MSKFKKTSETNRKKQESKTLKSESSKEAPKPQTPEFIKGNEFPIGEGPEVVSLIKVELVGAMYKIQFILKIGKTVSVNVQPDLMLKVHSLVNLIAGKANWFDNMEPIVTPTSAPSSLIDFKGQHNRDFVKLRIVPSIAV